MSSKFPIRPAGLLLVMVLGVPGVAEAHVKWFCGPIDGSVPPLPVGQVLTPLFLELFAIFVGLVMLGAMLDAVATRVAGKLVVDPKRAGLASDLIVRAGVAVYALCLWGDLAVVMWADPSSGSLLTPDLYGAGQAVGYVQLATAVVVLIPRLSIFAAAALVGLYLMGVAKFGLFYMIDYLFFYRNCSASCAGKPDSVTSSDQSVSRAHPHRVVEPQLDVDGSGEVSVSAVDDLDTGFTPGYHGGPGVLNGCHDRRLCRVFPGILPACRARDSRPRRRHVAGDRFCRCHA
nr:hypothetical protein [Sphingomonas sp. H160509]